MEKNTRLEHYLGKLEKGLGQIPVSEKAEIITEIKSHILDAQAKDGTKKIEDILSAIGEPELVANRYLLERGLKPMKAPTHPIFKWLIIGFLGTFVTIVLFVSLIIWKFTPIMKIQNDKVTFLGGVIDIDENSDVYFDRSMNVGKDAKVDNRTFDASQIKKITIMSGSGDIKIVGSKDPKVNLTVARKGLSCDLITKLNNGELTITTSDKRSCSFVSIKINVLKNTNIKARTGSGDIDVTGVNADVEANSGSGDISVAVDGKARSQLNLRSGSGDFNVAIPKDAKVSFSFLKGSGDVHNDFSNSENPDIKIKIMTGSGNINLKAK